MENDITKLYQWWGIQKTIWPKIYESITEYGRELTNKNIIIMDFVMFVVFISF